MHASPINARVAQFARTEDLKNLSLVSRKWRERAEPILFATARLSFGRGRRAKDFIQAARNRNLVASGLLRYCRTLVIDIYPDTQRSPESDIRPLFPDGLAAVCPHLRYLRLDAMTEADAIALIDPLFAVATGSGHASQLKLSLGLLPNRFAGPTVPWPEVTAKDEAMGLAFGAWAPNVVALRLYYPTITKATLENLGKLSQLAYLRLYSISRLVDEKSLPLVTLPALQSMKCSEMDGDSFQDAFFTWDDLMPKLKTPNLVSLAFTAMQEQDLNAEAETYGDNEYERAFMSMIRESEGSILPSHCPKLREVKVAHLELEVDYGKLELPEEHKEDCIIS